MHIEINLKMCIICVYLNLTELWGQQNTQELHNIVASLFTIIMIMIMMIIIIIIIIIIFAVIAVLACNYSRKHCSLSGKPHILCSFGMIPAATLWQKAARILKK